MKNRSILLLLVLVMISLVLYFNNRQGGVEMYNAEKNELLGYITGDDFKPDKFDSMISKMTQDDDVKLTTSILAKEYKYDALFEFVDNYFPNL